ncbi:MAG TPA: C39 family peptidase [Chthoniobacterales bacterium]|nr:C39 family peptidase [Chthoniobacterales bacterium]
MFTKVEDSKMPQEGVDPRQALDAARLHVRRAWAGEVQGFEAWGGYDIEAEPLVIHDLNGQVLFYEFTVSSGKSQVGSIKTSASRVIGSPVVTIEFGPRTWSERKAVERAKAEARKLFPKARLSPPDLVCYCYPKLGVRIFAEDDRGRRGVIVDVADGSVVERLGASGEGFAAYSFYDEVAEPQREVRLRRFAQADREMETVRREGPELFKAERLDNVAKVRDFFMSRSVGLVAQISLYSSRVLKYGPRCTPHDCFQLYAQETPVYCAVATAQMILDFYRWNFTQDEIATAMHTDSGGTNNTDQVAGYQSLSNQTLVATFDETASWSEARAEIDANRPVKSGVPHHARAVAGWKQQNLSIVGTAPKRWLLIYDPWPWDANLCAGGKVVWEDWDAVDHTNFITVRHRTTACG